jgi:hypothetical protein
MVSALLTEAFPSNGRASRSETNLSDFECCPLLLRAGAGAMKVRQVSNRMSDAGRAAIEPPFTRQALESFVTKIEKEVTVP